MNKELLKWMQKDDRAGINNQVFPIEDLKELYNGLLSLKIKDPVKDLKRVSWIYDIENMILISGHKI